MSKQIYTVKVNEDKYREIKDFYQPYFKDNSGAYIDFYALKEGVIITGYLSKKQNKKITFEGEGAYLEAKKWDTTIEENKENEPLKAHWIDYEDQIGSDEVGTGDLFLPVIVVAAFVKKDDISFLKEIGVNDSKKLTDEKIKEIAPKIIKKIICSKMTLPIEKYNEVVKGENLNSIKAKMHNRALNNLHEQYIDVTHIYVDQFVNEKSYYKYLKEGNDHILKDVSFKTKGESYFPSVASASIIARYYLLVEKEKLESKYQIPFAFGSGKPAVIFANEFIKKYGIEEFKKIAKHHFKTYQEILAAI